MRTTQPVSSVTSMIYVFAVSVGPWVLWSGKRFFTTILLYLDSLNQQAVLPCWHLQTI